MRRYPMSLSGGVVAISALVSGLILSVPLLVWGVVPGIRLGPASEMARWLVLLAPVVVLVSWALSPTAVELEGGELRVLRRAWRAAAWPLAGVESAEVLPPGSLRGSIRTFGSGGLFGFYGWYFKKGAFRLFATRTGPLVEIRVEGKRVVVSPDAPLDLVAGLRATVPRLQETFRPPTHVDRTAG